MRSQDVMVAPNQVRTWKHSFHRQRDDHGGHKQFVGRWVEDAPEDSSHVVLSSNVSICLFVIKPEANPHASLSPPIRSHGRSSSPDPTNRSPSPSSPKSPKAGSGPLPGAVSFTKALLSEDGLPTNPENSGLDQNGSSSMSTSRSNGGSSGPRAAENPFFGSAGSSRERLSKSAVSASSGSGKVISGLQSELLARSSALDTARQQLRVSQRAVEFLTRQNEDLTESKDRLSTENEQLTKTINRKERLQSESTSRALLAETSLSALQKSHQEAVSTHNARLKEAEDKAEEAEGARWKAESEYGSLREGMKSMAEGWKADLDWLKEDLKKLQEKHGRELDEAKLKHMALTKLFKAKEAEHVDVKSTINIIQASLKTTERTIAELSERFEGSSTGVAFANDEEALRRCQELEGEFRRLRRLMRDHT
ncbi:hypothetical protein P7C70_g5968, partial [Phenoliferia sp. Uapishka_3]